MINIFFTTSRRAAFAAAVFLTLMLANPFPLQAEPPAEKEDTLVVMTYNLRFASSRGPNAWPDRRPIMRDCIRELNPDLIGTQEGVYHQLRDIAADLPEYDWIGLGRDGGSRGEFMAVYYRKDRFEPLEYDHFWLSDTPEVIASVTWGHSNRRMVTWVRFLDNQTGREFYFFNTHFDHAVQPAREKSAELVLERVRALKTDLPIILLGDFNARAGDNKVFDLLVNDDAFVDSWDTAKEHVNPDLNTFNGFRPGPHTGGRRIDWILYRGPFVVDKTGIYDYAQNGQFPSDHFPVVAWMRLE